VRVKRVGVVGAGTMGAGIAQIAALGGYETRLHDPVPEALHRAMQRLRGGLEKGAAKGLWSKADAEAASELADPAASLGELVGCELVIEAAPEEVELKRELFAALAEICGPQTILATNTSSLQVTAIATMTPRPERVVGMHFFNPPALMRLVEVIATADSAEDALVSTAEVARQMGRTPIRAKDSPGFLANRLARPFTLEPLRILGEGVARARDIDRVCRIGGGFRMGPFELIDLIGLDVNLRIARSLYAQGGEPERWRPSPIQEELVKKGRLGRKSGHGFYNYGDGPHRESDPDLQIEAPSLDPGELAKIDPAGPTILPRLLAQISNEAAFALEEKVGSPGDIDTAMRLGFNWPLGPLEFAEMLGAQPARSLLKHLEHSRGAAYRVAPLLRTAAEREAPLRGLAA